MRYRLTKKGRIVFTVLSVFLLLSICGIAFGVRGVINLLRDNPNPQSDPPTESDIVLENLSSPPPDPSETLNSPTESPSPSATLTSPTVTEPSPDPSEAGSPAPSSNASDRPSAAPERSSSPAEPSTIPVTLAPSPSKPPATRDIYESRYLIRFPKNESKLDEAELSKQLKSVLSADGTTYTPPKMQSHCLVIQGFAEEGEKEGIALERSRFVRGVLRSIGLTDNKMLDMSADDKDVDSLNSVLLYFVQIDNK